MSATNDNQAKTLDATKIEPLSPQKSESSPAANANGISDRVMAAGGSAVDMGKNIAGATYNAAGNLVEQTGKAGSDAMGYANSAAQEGAKLAGGLFDSATKGVQSGLSSLTGKGTGSDSKK